MEIVSFVILHYKDVKITDACVRSILRMEEQNRIQIVIVDNDIDKKDEERQRFAARYRNYPQITVLTVHKNGGFSHANNLGYRYSREKLKASYIIAANNDIEFTQTDFIKRLDKSFRQHPCHVLGPDILNANTDEHQSPMDTRLRTEKEARYTVRMNRLALKLFPVVWPFTDQVLKKQAERKRSSKKANREFYHKVQNDIVPYGACLIFTPDFVRGEALAFTPETPFFYEEYILAYRCRKNGQHILYDPSLKVLHENGASTKKTYRSEKKRLRFMLEKTAAAGEIYLKMITGG